MKILALALLIASLQSDTSALVDASKDAKPKRKKSTSKVITNKDVKKSKGRMTQLGELQPVPGAESPLAKQSAERKTRIETEASVAALEKEIEALEKELVKIEQSYFEENDLNVRDTVIVRKFNETKTKLDAAKAELATLRP
jgi:hypothetical protein